MWYTSRRHPAHGHGHASSSPPGQQHQHHQHHASTSDLDGAGTARRWAGAGALPMTFPSSSSSQLTSPTPLRHLAHDEQLLAQRKLNVRNYGVAWIRPPGVPKSLHQLREEKREAEEHAEQVRREERAQELAEAEAQAAEELARREAALAAAQARAEAGLEEGDADGDPEGELAGLVDLDDMVPDAEERSAEGSSEEDEDEEEEEEEAQSESDEGARAGQTSTTADPDHLHIGNAALTTPTNIPSLRPHHLPAAPTRQQQQQGQAFTARGGRPTEDMFREAIRRGTEARIDPGFDFGLGSDGEVPRMDSDGLGGDASGGAMAHGEGMLQEEDLVQAHPPSGIDGDTEMDMGLDMDLDADIPDADEEDHGRDEDDDEEAGEGLYEHTDTDQELESSIDDDSDHQGSGPRRPGGNPGSIFGNGGDRADTRPVEASSSMVQVRSDGTQNSLDLISSPPAEWAPPRIGALRHARRTERQRGDGIVGDTQESDYGSTRRAAPHGSPSARSTRQSHRTR